MYLARCLLQKGQGVARVEARVVEVVVLWSVMFCREESITEFDGELRKIGGCHSNFPPGETDGIRKMRDMPLIDTLDEIS
jgi:hypothetical protein